MSADRTLFDVLDESLKAEFRRKQLIAASGRAGAVAARREMGVIVNQALEGQVRCRGIGWRRGWGR